jgi:hypothetical protein
VSKLNKRERRRRRRRRQRNGPNKPPIIPANLTKKFSRVVVLSRMVRCIDSISYLKKMPVGNLQNQL